LSAVYVNQTNLDVRLSTQLGTKLGAAKNLGGGIVHPGHQ